MASDSDSDSDIILSQASQEYEEKKARDLAKSERNATKLSLGTKPRSAIYYETKGHESVDEV